MAELHVLYRKYLADCISQIENCNDHDITDIIYTVPTNILTHEKYDRFDCLEYIESKLRKKYLDTYIVSDTQIFVSWVNIEINKKMEHIIKK